jgi:hypothetical protein
VPLTPPPRFVSKFSAQIAATAQIRKASLFTPDLAACISAALCARVDSLRAHLSILVNVKWLLFSHGATDGRPPHAPPPADGGGSVTSGGGGFSSLMASGADAPKRREREADRRRSASNLSFKKKKSSRWGSILRPRVPAPALDSWGGVQILSSEESCEVPKLETIKNVFHFLSRAAIAVAMTEGGGGAVSSATLGSARLRVEARGFRDVLFIMAVGQTEGGGEFPFAQLSLSLLFCGPS